MVMFGANIEKLRHMSAIHAKVHSLGGKIMLHTAKMFMMKLYQGLCKLHIIKESNVSLMELENPLVKEQFP